MDPQGCPADAEIWRGLQVCEEQPRDGYDRDAFGTGYRSLGDDIIAALPATMRAAGQVYTPYSCLAFDIAPDGTAATDIEHIIALAEAHDSRIADDRRRDIASDLDNLTIADPTVNRSQKSDRDAAGWMPERHGQWFAARVIAVKLEYGLSVDRAERDALEALLAGGGAELNCVDADTTSPTVVISSDAVAPVTGPFSISVAFSEPVTGFELADLVVGNGGASALQGNSSSYSATITPAASGVVTVDIAAGAAEDDAGNPSVAADQFTIVADLTQVPMNRPPAPAVTLPSRTLAPDDTLNVDVSGAFVDPDGDALSFTASSSTPQVVTASVTGAFVMLAAAREGAATIRVTATDPGGLSATQSFTVTVEVSVSVPFTDHPIRPGVTPVKAVHFTELRARIDALRRAAGLPAFSWTDAVLRAGVMSVKLAAPAGAPGGAGCRLRCGRALGAGLDRPAADGGVHPDQGGARDGAAGRGGGAGVTRRPRFCALRAIGRLQEAGIAGTGVHIVRLAKFGVGVLAPTEPYPAVAVRFLRGPLGQLTRTDRLPDNRTMSAD